MTTTLINPTTEPLAIFKFECPPCLFKTKSLSGLRHHILTGHNFEFCPVHGCDYKFVSKEMRKALHFKTRHDPEHNAWAYIFQRYTMPEKTNELYEAARVYFAIKTGNGISNGGLP